MKKELEAKLYKRFPQFFEWRRPRQYKSKLLSWFSAKRHQLYWNFLYDQGLKLSFVVCDDHKGFLPLECGDGWFDLIYEMCEKIERLEPPDTFWFVQIKEKFASLRAYTSFYNMEIEEIIDRAADKSSKTCEKCGKEGSLVQHHGWYSTKCEECDER